MQYLHWATVVKIAHRINAIVEMAAIIQYGCNL